MNSLKIVTAGDGTVGKTSLLMAYTTNSFTSDYMITVFDNYQANVLYNDRALTLNLWDSSGQESYDRLRPLSYPKTDVFILCFSVISSTSFLNVKSKWITEINHYCPGVPIVLVGTKIDLRDDYEIIEKISKKELRCMSKEEGIQLAKEINACCYIECSSKTQEGLKSVFDEAIRFGMDYKIKKNKVKQKKCKIL